jgi:hypothetical protein
VKRSSIITALNISAAPRDPLPPPPDARRHCLARHRLRRDGGGVGGDVVKDTTAVAIINTVVAVSTAALIVVLWHLGAGGWSFWGFALMAGFCKTSKYKCEGNEP